MRIMSEIFFAAESPTRGQHCSGRSYLRSYMLASDDLWGCGTGARWRVPRKERWHESQGNMATGRLGFFFDVDFDFGGHVAEDLDGDRKFPDGLDGIGKLHLALVHFELLLLERFGDIARCDGAEHLV